MKLIVKPWFHSFYTAFGPKHEYYIKFICIKFISKQTLSSEYTYVKTISNCSTKDKLSLSNKRCDCVSPLIAPCHSRSFYTELLVPHIFKNQLNLSNGAFLGRSYSTNSETPTEEKPSQVDKKNEENKTEFGLVKKFKLMYKQYWYVLIPVHIFTSLIWYGSFFFAAKSGVDIVHLLENIGLSEKFLYYLRNSNAGYYGIAYAMYKLATPARYTVTLGGTTLSINYLKNRGYIKPVPTRDELKVMYQDKREEIRDMTDEMREKYHGKREELLERAGEIHDRYQDKKEEIRIRYHDKRKEFMRRQRIQRNSKDRPKLNGKNGKKR